MASLKRGSRTGERDAQEREEGGQFFHDRRCANVLFHPRNTDHTTGAAEICDIPEQGKPNGGVTLVDVTNPEEPEYLAEGVGDLDSLSVTRIEGVAHQVHSAFAWDGGRKAYAVLVDDEEGEDVDIMDITDPREPKLIKEYNLNEDFPQIVQEDLGTAESFLHDIIVKQIDGRWVMLLSYCDGGYVQLDVTNPREATYIADSDFTNPDPEASESGFTVEPEGNAHQADCRGGGATALGHEARRPAVRPQGRLIVAQSANVFRSQGFATTWQPSRARGAEHRCPGTRISTP